MLKLSLIIPVYNVELYLRKCLDSVLNQGLNEEEYEVILVNDGSKDGSLSICNEYAEKHPNFKIISQENSGVSAARNNGIDHAVGEFVGFIDSDDYFLDNGLYLATCQFNNRKDIDIIHYYSSYDFWEVKPIDNSIDFDSTTFENIKKGGLPSFCWLYLYRREFLNKYHLRFKKYVVGEDVLFTSSVFLKNARMVSTKANIYRYVIRDNSASTKRSKEFSRKCVDDYINALYDLQTIIKEDNVERDPEVYNVCINTVNYKKMFGFSRILSSDFSWNEFKHIKQQCKEKAFYPVVPYTSGWKNRMQCKIMNLALKNTFVYKTGAFLFNSIVVPFVLPVLRKNFK